MTRKFLVSPVLPADPTVALDGNDEAVRRRSFTSSTRGVVPASGGGTVNYLRADGSWQQPPSSTVGGHASFTFNATTTEPITGNQLRLNNATQTAATKLWVSKTSTDGLDVTVALAKIKTGHQIYLQDRDDSTKWIKYTVTADGVDDGIYYDFSVAYHSGPGNIPAQTVELQPISPNATGLPPGGTTGQALTKTSATDFAVSWTTVSGGGGVPTTRLITATSPIRIDGGASADLSADRTLSIANDSVTNTQLALMPADTIKGNNTGGSTGPLDLTVYATQGMLRRPVIADTTTAFAPVVATHENTFVTLSNAGAITVTMPSNTTSAFAIGAEVDFLWFGVGQPTFAAGGGATVNGTPGLKLRARYSAATAKKVATNDWIIIGDLSA